MEIQSAGFRVGYRGCWCLGFACRDCSPETRTINRASKQGFPLINLFTRFWDFPVFGLTIHPCQTKRHRDKVIELCHLTCMCSGTLKQPGEAKRISQKKQTATAEMPRWAGVDSERLQLGRWVPPTSSRKGYQTAADIDLLHEASSTPGACTSREMPGGPLAMVAKPKHRVRCFGFELALARAGGHQVCWLLPSLS